MARTYGEILPASYAAVFTADELVGGGVPPACGRGVGSQTSTPAKPTPTAADSPLSSRPIRVFVDVGSGHGAIVRAAVADGGFDRGIGIEKYREPQAIANAMHASCDPTLRACLAFHLADFADVDLAGLVRQAVAGVVEERRVASGGADAQAAAPPPPTTLTIFINNLAFPPGVSGRHGRQLASIAEELGREGVPVTVVSAVPLAALEDKKACLPPSSAPSSAPSTLTLAMTFNPAHDARVYLA